MTYDALQCHSAMGTYIYRSQKAWIATPTISQKLQPLVAGRPQHRHVRQRLHQQGGVPKPVRARQHAARRERERPRRGGGGGRRGGRRLDPGGRAQQVAQGVWRRARGGRAAFAGFRNQAAHGRGGWAAPGPPKERGAACTGCLCRGNAK